MTRPGTDTPRRRGRLRRWIRLGLAAAAAALLVAFVLGWISTAHFRSFGGTPGPATLARIHDSAEFVDGRFQNPEATALMAPSAYGPAFKTWAFGDEMRVPSCPLPLVTDTAARLARPPGSGLRITWLGHSTTLIELDGAVILTDPIWSERASPSRWVGPRRYHPPPVPLADLPRLDAVLISHEHYDHLDMATIEALARLGAKKIGRASCRERV